MNRLLQLSHGIDRVTGWFGRLAFGGMLVIVLMGAFNAIARKVGSALRVTLTSNLFVELQWYLFAAIFLLAGAYTLRQNAHVRVDILYDRFSAKTRSWVNLIGHAVFLVPFSLYVVWISFGPQFDAEEGWRFIGPVVESWRIEEGSPDPGGLPRYPIKSVVPLGFALLALQGLSEIVKNLAVVSGRSHEETEPDSTGPEDDEAGHV